MYIFQFFRSPSPYQWLLVTSSDKKCTLILIKFASLTHSSVICIGNNNRRQKYHSRAVCVCVTFVRLFEKSKQQCRGSNEGCKIFLRHHPILTSLSVNIPIFSYTILIIPIYNTTTWMKIYIVVYSNHGICRILSLLNANKGFSISFTYILQWQTQQFFNRGVFCCCILSVCCVSGRSNNKYFYIYSENENENHNLSFVCLCVCVCTGGCIVCVCVTNNEFYKSLFSFIFHYEWHGVNKTGKFEWFSSHTRSHTKWLSEQ